MWPPCLLPLHVQPPIPENRDIFSWEGYKDNRLLAYGLQLCKRRGSVIFKEREAGNC